jgi:uncharacterized membrane protein YjdF
MVNIDAHRWVIIDTVIGINQTISFVKSKKLSVCSMYEFLGWYTQLITSGCCSW